jgi:hypothetical protein
MAQRVRTVLAIVIDRAFQPEHAAGPFWCWRIGSRFSTIQRMPSIRAVLIIPVLLLCLSACEAYDPPVQGDHTAVAYKADLEKCRASSTETVRRKNAGYPGTWIMSPFTGPPEVRATIRTCMAGKGYVLDKSGG